MGNQQAVKVNTVHGNTVEISFSDFVKGIVNESNTQQIERIDDIISVRIKTHVLECPAGKKLDRICWMFAGAFSSGAIGGTALGAWLAKMLANGEITNLFLHKTLTNILG